MSRLSHRHAYRIARLLCRRCKSHLSGSLRLLNSSTIPLSCQSLHAEDPSNRPRSRTADINRSQDVRKRRLSSCDTVRHRSVGYLTHDKRNATIWPYKVQVSHCKEAFEA